MKLSIDGIELFLLTFLSIIGNGQTNNFGYECAEGPESWRSLNIANVFCNSTQQSPIDIPAANSGFVPTSSESTPVKNYIKPVALATFTVSQGGHGVTALQSSPKYTCTTLYSCGFIVLNAVTYYLMQVHCHAPSEHTVNGVRYAMECHYVHETQTSPASSGPLLVYGILFDGSGSAPSQASTTLSHLFSFMPATSERIQANLGAYLLNEELTP